VKRFFLGWVAVFIVLHLSRGQMAPGWEEQFQQAYGLLQNGKLEEATERFETLSKLNPGDPELPYAIGTALDATGHHPEATGWYLKALKLNPRLGPAYNNLALNYASRGEFEKALPLLRKVTQLDAHDEQAFYNLGLVQLKLKHYGPAAEAFQQAHRLKPKEHDPLLRLVYSCLLAGRRQVATQAIASFLMLPGDTCESALQVMQVLNSAGFYRDALTQAQKSRAAGKCFAQSSYEEASALFHLGQYQQAVDVLQKAGPANNPTGDYYLLLGSAQALLKDLPGAVNAFQAAVRAAPENPETYYRLSLVFLEGFRDQDAAEVLNTGLELIPNSPLLLYAEGIAQEVTGRYREAIENMQKSLAAKSDQPAVWSVLGDLYVEVGQYLRAGEAYQNAIRQGGSSDTSVKYADLLIHLQRFTEAEKLLQQLARTQARNIQVYVTLGKLYGAQKQYSKAEKVLRRAIELDPDNADAHWFLTGTLKHLGLLEEAKREGEVAAEKKAKVRESQRTSLLRAALIPQTPTAVPGTSLK
jgi:tetratricopeptide (TPR) repeat protein